MDQIIGVALHDTQQRLLTDMHRNAALIASGIAQAEAPILPAAPDFSVRRPNRVAFAPFFQQAIDHVDVLQHSASSRQTALEMGQNDDLAETMIASQKASLAFLALMQVRNKLTSSLDEIINTTV